MTSNSKINVPEARQAMYNMKHEVASELGINLKQGYNGDLTSKQAGSIGGSMVKDMVPVRTFEFERNLRSARGHAIRVRLAVGIEV